MKFTIITVAYNAEESIAETINSVLEQDYENFEYLILDGGSSDGTMDIAKNLVKGSKSDVKIFSERDFGIYNAMNKGILRASGEYVIFMNSGDQFYDKNVLSQLSAVMNQKGKKIYYGKIYRVHCSRGSDRVKDFSKICHNVLQGFFSREMPCHQGIIAPISSLKGFYFNEDFKYCADFDWLIRCYKSGYKLVNTGCMICRYDNTGLTSGRSSRNQMRKESDAILKKNFPVMFRLWYTTEKLKKGFWI